MTSILNVKDIYNSVAIATGFPQYSNDTDTPDITRFLLDAINEGLHIILDSISSATGTVDRVEQIITIKGEDKYGVDGIIKHIEITLPNGQISRIRYLNNIDEMATQDSKKMGYPKGYTIDAGWLKLYPIPDGEYTLNLRLSSNDIVLSDNDTYKANVTDIEDSIIGSEELGILVKLRAITLILIRCQNQASALYGELGRTRLMSYCERQIGSTEARRGMQRNGGHYNANRGLLG